MRSSQFSTIFLIGFFLYHRMSTNHKGIRKKSHIFHLITNMHDIYLSQLDVKKINVFVQKPYERFKILQFCRTNTPTLSKQFTFHSSTLILFRICQMFARIILMSNEISSSIAYVRIVT